MAKWHVEKCLRVKWNKVILTWSRRIAEVKKGETANSNGESRCSLTAFKIVCRSEERRSDKERQRTVTGNRDAVQWVLKSYVVAKSVGRTSVW